MSSLYLVVSTSWFCWSCSRTMRRVRVFMSASEHSVSTNPLSLARKGSTKSGVSRSSSSESSTFLVGFFFGEALPFFAGASSSSASSSSLSLSSSSSPSSAFFLGAAFFWLALALGLLALALGLLLFLELPRGAVPLHWASEGFFRKSNSRSTRSLCVPPRSRARHAMISLSCAIVSLSSRAWNWVFCLSSVKVRPEKSRMFSLSSRGWGARPKSSRDKTLSGSLGSVFLMA
mmetsp:Transcript_24482/g.58350  ORF Transcript_24482/g.58350 Transcript_24482/m.58350 type:complete len:232 (+) Transcript_24482:328-1023(+)